MTDDNHSTSASAEKRDDKQQAELHAQITRLFERRICFNEFLGFRIEQLEPSPVRIGFDMRPELIGHFLHGRLHGGVISSVLDVAGGLAVMMGIANYYKSDDATAVLNRFTHLATIDLRVDYLRQGVGEQFWAEADLVRLGKRVAVCQMRLTNNSDSLIATGNANYIVS